MFALLSLHLFMYGCNLFMWESTRINYNFIFEFSPNTALTYRDAFFLCTTFMTIVVGAMVVHLLLGNSTCPVNAIPGILLLVSDINFIVPVVGIHIICPIFCITLYTLPIIMSRIQFLFG